jgi:hypothetical protein
MYTAAQAMPGQGHDILISQRGRHARGTAPVGMLRAYFVALALSNMPTKASSGGVNEQYGIGAPPVKGTDYRP